MAANTGVVIQQIMLEGLQHLAEIAEKRVRKPRIHPHQRQPCPWTMHFNPPFCPTSGSSKHANFVAFFGGRVP